MTTDLRTDLRTPPTVPGRLPLLGHAVPLIRDRLAFVQHVRAFGPLVRITVGPKSATFVNSPELIHEMLTAKADQFSKGLLFEKLKLFGKDALPTAEGKPHLHRRRQMQPAFHREKISGYVDSMQDAVAPSVAGWRAGTELDLKTEMQLVTQNIVMSVLFSSVQESGPARAILDSVDTVFMASLRRALVPVSALERLPTRRNRRVKESNSLLRTTVARILAEHRADPDAFDDIVSLLLTVENGTGEALSDDEILSEIIALLAAGSETTAVVLAWLFHELGRNPELEQRLHEEVDAVLAGDRITVEHIGRLVLTRRLIDETLRLHNPAWLVTRQALSTVSLGPFELPAGADLVWSPYALHRDPELYPDPERFDPDRWLPERPQPPKGAYIPFGSGKRMCIGDAFALTEAVVITALIASRWRLRPTGPDTVRAIGEITVHPSSLRMVPEAR